jgi:holin-like protein
MRLLRQFLIIAAFSFLGEVAKALIPFSVPASVYGLFMMLAALSLGVVKPHQVRDAAKYLIEIMPLMFVPVGVGLMNTWGMLKPILLPFAVISVVSTFAVLAATGHATQAVVRLTDRRAGR